MKQQTTIAYVDLPKSGVPEPSSSFFLRRYHGDHIQPPASDVPHRHNYQEMIVVQSGTGRHTIDGHSIDLLPSTVALVAKGQVHNFEHATELTGWLVRFTDDFLPSDVGGQIWNYHATILNQMGGTHTLVLTTEELQAVAVVLELMEAEWMHPTRPHSESCFRHLLSILLIHLERTFRQSLAAQQQERETYQLHQQFVTLLDAEFSRHHDVQFYADALQIPPVKLSRILNRTLGKATKQLIDERIVLEAQRYLQYADLSITEIALALGYNDVFHLSKTFKRVTGIAPQTFREQRQKMT
jgi:AraC family transcriptional activator of pobA